LLCFVVFSKSQIGRTSINNNKERERNKKKNEKSKR